MAPIDNFSVVLGGPLFRLYRLARLSDDSLGLVARRATALALLTWLPLLFLTLLEGNAWSGVAQPFLLDVDVHVRLLVALPLLLYAEKRVHRRMRSAIPLFVTRGLVPESARPKFDEALDGVARVRESRLLEVALLVFVYGVGIAVVWHSVVALDLSSWYRVGSGQETHLTLAGWWYAVIGLPLFQFVIYRWYVRLGIWGWFLWKLSRCGLILTPMHPDRCGGMGFLGVLCYAFVPVLLAHGALFSGVAAAGILLDGRALAEYAFELMVASTLVLLFVLGPLSTFVPVLVAAKRAGLRDYGMFAQRYVGDFHQKWVLGQPAGGMLGSPDIQSLADLSVAYENVAMMRLFPVSLQAVVRLVITTLIPLAPLALTMLRRRTRFDAAASAVLGGCTAAVRARGAHHGHPECLATAAVAADAPRRFVCPFVRG